MSSILIPRGNTTHPIDPFWNFSDVPKPAMGNCSRTTTAFGNEQWYRKKYKSPGFIIRVPLPSGHRVVNPQVGGLSSSPSPGDLCAPGRRRFQIKKIKIENHPSVCVCMCRREPGRENRASCKTIEVHSGSEKHSCRSVVCAGGSTHAYAPKSVLFSDL